MAKTVAISTPTEAVFLNATLTARTDVDQVMAYSRYCGWCTKYRSDCEHYLNNGRLWTIKKAGKRRPSYQIYINGPVMELMGKGNTPIRWDALLYKFPDLKEQLETIKKSYFKEFVPSASRNRSFRAINQDIHNGSQGALGHSDNVINVSDIYNIEVTSERPEYIPTLNGHYAVDRSSMPGNIEMKVSAMENQAIYQMEIGDVACLVFSFANDTFRITGTMSEKSIDFGAMDDSGVITFSFIPRLIEQSPMGAARHP